VSAVGLRHAARIAGLQPTRRNGINERLDKPETLEALARSDHRAARGAAALIEAGFAPDTEVEGLAPGSVTRQLAELLARELQTVYERLGEVYESAFVETATGLSLEFLVDGLRLRPNDDDDD
jgi:hypothetical protein